MKSKDIALKILLLSCSFFAPITFLFDILIAVAFSYTELLGLGATFIILVLSFIISSFRITLSEKPVKIIEKFKILSYSMGFYAILSLILKILVSIVNYSSKKALWNVNIFSIIVIFAFSIAISICILYLKPKNTYARLIIYFFGIGVFYYILTVTIGGLAVGNALILIISAYVMAFSVVATAIAVVSSRKKKKERDSKPYQNQF